jgi:hypothetical protein
MKGPMAGPRKDRSKTMKLISTHELNKCSDSELSALFHTVWISLIRTTRGSPERRNALASLENIGRARTSRQYGCRP